ncbi:NTF2 fold immunity protein [Pedobacter steynii]|uniref:NTF2 fold immunity protein n=1 Tax=Pedobacter steynii TaxID=430522 RepID=A0A1H0K0A2_9SPHI|nr:NTF2 fold immunity protein [Pedobacter steynii]NQX43208.1 hypothetical protein [Pedobacter steynii]SDO49132.1 NTF2 fold immunity protein [Pedobacter steynii]
MSSLQFKDRTFTTEEIRDIAAQTKLLGLSFENCPITDEDIAQLCHLPKLVNLSLEHTNITDRSLEHLANLLALNYLFITGANLNGSGFKSFENHRKIDCIWACSTKLNDDGLRLLANIPKLGTIRILDTAVTFEGLLSVADNQRICVVADDMFSREQMEQFEQEQRNQAKSKKNTNPEAVEEARAILLSFFQAMTDWEKYAEASFASSQQFAPDLQPKCEAIFHQYCTDKPRNGYRPTGLFFAGGPKYTYGEEQFTDVEQPSKNKIIFYTKNHNDFQYRYLVLKKENEWRVDERQWHSTGWKKNGL